MLDVDEMLNHEDYEDHKDYKNHILPFCFIIFIYHQKYGKVDLMLRSPESSRCMAGNPFQNSNNRT